MTTESNVSDLIKIRELVSNLITASGCSCCRNDEEWDKAEEELAGLLKVPKYKNGSGYEYNKFQTIYPQTFTLMED